MKTFIPLNVPRRAQADYLRNFRRATHGTGRLMLFAGDQKIEHLNNDFAGADISADDNHPEHLFQVASRSRVGVFAAQLGLIANHAHRYRRVNYLIKLNSKTDLLPTTSKDPLSTSLNTIEQVVSFQKNSGLRIVGVGYTLYPGSAFEDQMLAEAGRLIYEAHQHGLLVVLWIYLRGQAIKKPKEANLLAGAAGIAAALGADFVKINYPDNPTKDKLQTIIKAAGNTGVIFSGGESIEVKKFLKTLYDQLQAGARGNATGRNIHQKSLDQAINMSNAISSLVINQIDSDTAYRISQGKAQPPSKFFRFF